MNSKDSPARACIPSPIGELVAHVEGGRLVALDFPGVHGAKTGSRPSDVAGHPLLARVADELAEYFARCRTVFDVPLAPCGTAFQQRVWTALLAIPYGETESYAAIAHRIGQPAAVRAVGLANARNPIPILIPCHRVIGTDGSLTGYAGGLAIKQALLELEGARRSSPRQSPLPLS